MRVNKVLKGLFVLLFLLEVSNVFSCDPQKRTKIYTEADTVKIGQQNAFSQLSLDPCQSTYRDWKISDMIVMGVDPNNRAYNVVDTLVEVRLEVIQTDRNNVSSSYEVNLGVNTMAKGLISNYINQQTFLFSDVYSFSVRVLEIKVNGQNTQVLPAYIYINSEINVERYIQFAYNQSTECYKTFNNTICDGANGEIVISWDQIEGANEYQLEWTFVNDYKQIDGEYLPQDSIYYDFKGNSTRITTANQYFAITKTFEHGWLLYRVRGVGRDIDHPENLIFGVWTVGSDNGLVSTVSDDDKYHNESEHEKNKNWQYSATYAEEGKKKEVISYFDGSLRNRQSVTKTNTENTVIVGQTIYDYQGRPSINVLPVPVSDTLKCDDPSTVSNVIKYYERFNRDSRDSTYSSFNFDNITTCNNEADAMNTNSGASNYYSSDNPNKINQQAYLPDAQGYPFTQVQYTPDNTGRVISQSGVGETFKLGSGKEIKNYYGQPNQIQLDRMFGSEAGYYEHYKKNLVFDANGQASVSYLNQEGKVVATSLTGAVPTGLSALPGAADLQDTLTISMLNPNALYLSDDGNSLIFGNTILVAEDNSTYTFDYDISIADYTDTCLNENICYSCVYDLQVIITDFCGNTVPKVGGDTTYSTVKMIGNFELINDTVHFKTTCSGTYDYQMSSVALTLNRGSYSVNKILTLNQDALAYYLKEYTDTTKNHCLKTFGEFKQEAMTQIDLSSCNISCESCLAALGTRQNWIDSARGTALEWDVLYEKCIEPCQAVSVCESTYEMLLTDVSRSGQYGQYLLEVNNSLVFSPSSFPLSVFNENNHLGINENWRNPSIRILNNQYPYYLDEDGEKSLIELNLGLNGVYYPEYADGVVPITDENGNKYIYPQQLKKVEDFIDLWKPNWAKSLVKYHPEYCFYLECSKYSIKYPQYNITSSDFDMLLMQTPTYQDAIDNHLIDSINHTVYDFFEPSTTHAYDPYAIDDSEYHVDHNNMFSVDFEYVLLYDKWTNYAQNKCMKEIASYTARYTTYYGAILGDTAYTKFGTGNTVNNDNEWNLFKSMYLTEKQTIQQMSSTTCLPNDNAWYTNNRKVRRFYSRDNLPVEVNTSLAQTDADIYQRTQQCPAAFEFMNFISDIASTDSLNQNNISLVNYPIFSLRLYELVRGSSSNPFVPVYWTINNSSTSDNLIVNLKDNTVPPAFNEKTLVINKAGTGLYWSDIEAIQDLDVTYFDGTYYHFTAFARIFNAENMPDQYDFKQITGYTNVNIGSCTFQDDQTANSLSVDLRNLWNQLIASGTFNSQTPVSLEQIPYQQFLTHNIRSLTSYAPDLKWMDANNGDFYIYSDDPNIKLVMRVNQYNPAIFEIDSIASFGVFSINNREGFEVDALKSNNVVETHFSGNVFILDENNNIHNVSLGNIGFHRNSNCAGVQYQMRDDLEYLLKGLTVSQSEFQNVISSNHLDSSYYFTSLIDSVFSNCTLNFNTHLVGIFDSIRITGNLIPTGELTMEGQYSSFFMLADFYLMLNNDVVVIHDTIFGGSPCLRISQCDCPQITEFDINKWDKETEFNQCMTYVRSISIDNRAVDYMSLGLVYACMSDSGIDSTGAYVCLALASNPDECESCFVDLYQRKSQNWIVTSVDGQVANKQEFIELVKSGITNTHFDTAPIQTNIPDARMPGATWYGGPETKFILFQKQFTLNSHASELDIEIMPLCMAYVFINNILVDSIENPSINGAYNSIHLSGYVQYLHQGNNFLNVLSTCPSEIIGVRGVIHSYQPCESLMSDTHQSYNFPDTAILNSCEQQLIATAMTNARNSHEQYMSQIRTDFITSYRTHCMKALENLTYTYIDKEYHFTLYYYDQAGNLIKTIPPEGVELLPINGPDSPDEIKIENDRAHKTHTVFTNHRMETRYEYNSLNQLVKQTTPDHDKMDIWELTLPNGLPKAVQITSSYFIDGREGFITGYMYQNGKNRGVLYKTYNGGMNWSKVNDLVTSEFNQVQFIDNVGYAVGNSGVVLKTIDHGTTWDLLPLYVSGITSNIQALNFQSAQIGIIVGNNNLIYKTTDGGSSFTAANTISANGTIKSITYYNSLYYLALNTTAGIGTIYTSSDGLSWTLQENNIRSKDLSNVCFADNKWFAVGDRGTLLISTDGNTWTEKKCDISTRINAIWFYNDNAGVALIEDANAKNKLMKTNNGGETWSILASNTSDNYNSFFFYKPNLGYVVGESGLIQNIVFAQNTISLTNFSRSKPRPFFNKNILRVHANTSGDQIWMVTSDTLYMGFIDSDSHFVWAKVNESAVNGYKSLYYNYQNNEGLFLKNDGTVIKVNYITASNTISKTTYSSSIKQMKQGGANVVAVDNSGNTKYALTSSLGTGFTSIANGVLSVTNIVSMDVSTTDVICVGNNGDIYHSAPFATTPVSWQNKSTNVLPLPINSIYSAGSNMYAVGDCGKMLKTADGVIWKSYSTGTYSKLNVVKCFSNSVWIAGNSGYLAKMYDNGTQITLNTVFNTYSQNNLNGFAINTSGDKAYAVGAYGTLIYLAYNGSTWNVELSEGSGTQNYDYKDVAFNGNSTTDVVVVGQNSALYNYSGISGMKNQKLYPPKLNSIHFVDGENGYLVGDAGIIRHTVNTGQTWTTVVPQTNPFRELKAVITVAPDVAIVAGESGYAGRITVNSSPYVLPSFGNTVNVLKTKGGVSILAGENGMLYKSVNGGVTWQSINTGLSTSINAIYIFDDLEHVIFGGSNSVIGIYNGVNVTYNGKADNIPAGAVINDIYFHDNRNGYVVGNNGLIYKCNLTVDAFDPSTEIDWKGKISSDNPSITGLFGLSDSTKVDITTIAFTSRYNGFIGGKFNVSNQTLWAYARLLHDESELYSTYFWYDRLGRMVVSRNTKQFNKQAYSYTLYDALGRISEVGEVTEPENSTRRFATIFGAYIGNVFNPKSINDTMYSKWIEANNRAQVTRTYYDYPIISISGVTQDNLRARVATATYSDIYSSDSTVYNHATHYSYDIHGNVKTMWQDNPALATINDVDISQRFKRIDYDYDLVSGKVNKVTYQSEEPDQFIHQYEYDADNRIVNVKTSHDGVFYDNDASYRYYLHGSLARVEIGEEHVQGIDYIYTLQGWIKGVNSNSLNVGTDPGIDGGITGSNQNFARDAFGYTLNYFSGDYQAIDPSKWTNVTNRFEAGTASSDWMSTRRNLYNGNISAMATTITNPDTREILPLGAVYRYDQLNRITEMKAYANFDFTNNVWKNESLDGSMYFNNYSYDANGNLLSLQRNNQAGVMFDSFKYKYLKVGDKAVSNRLYHVNDSINASIMTDDIDDEGTYSDASETINSWNNYEYDEIGNLQRDSSEGIKHIEWTAYGKIKSIERQDGYYKTINNIDVYPSNLEFMYDAMGNRIAKIEKPRDANGQKSSADWKTTYYIRDAQGNPMATYKKSSETETASYKLIEHPIYGSSRVGIDNYTVEFVGYTAPSNGLTSRVLGLKQYEITNHLGNVLTTISDKKIPIENNGVVDHYVADITTASDYYPFGSPMDGRTFSSEKYRFGFNGQEKDDEVAGAGNTNTALFWEYDTRLGRRWNLDPVVKPWESPYATFANNPIIYIDPTGANAGEITVDLKTGKRKKISTKGDEIGFDFIYYGHTADNGGFITDKREVIDRQKWYDNTVIKREEWGAAPTNGTDFISVPNPRDFYKYSVIHHSGNDNSPTVKDVQEKHLDNGWYDIGYHYAIDLQGNIYEGRSIKVLGAGAGPADSRAGLIHVIVLGDMQNEGFWEWSNDVLTQEALNSLVLLNQYLVMEYNIQYTGGHQEVRCNHTVCPGNQLMKYMNDIRKVSATKAPGCLYTDQ